MENILTLVQSKWNPNKYSYGTRESISTILTTDVHSEENVSEHLLTENFVHYFQNLQLILTRYATHETEV